jgi:uncharacterized protein (TIGR02145 family)
MKSLCLTIGLGLVILVSCTKPNLPEGTFTDSRDSKVYNWITVENQTWMTENMAYLPSVSPPAEGGYQDPFYYVQEYEGLSVSEVVVQENYLKYGVLYNWKAAQSACPQGWHLPSDEEWKDLERYLGLSDSDSDETGVRNSGNVGEKLKSKTGWVENGNGNNKIGFNVLPGGNRNKNGGFGSIGMLANFWTSTSSGSSVVFSRGLRYDGDGISRSETGHDIGLSVRCLKN